MSGDLHNSTEKGAHINIHALAGHVCLSSGGCCCGDVLVETQAIEAMEVHWISGRRLRVADIDTISMCLDNGDRRWRTVDQDSRGDQEDRAVGHFLWRLVQPNSALRLSLELPR